MLPREEVYGATGIQIMQFNSLYQLYAMQRDRSSQLAAAERLLFMPDALSYLLTGEMVTEYTIASTSQLLNPRTKRIEARLLEKMRPFARTLPPDRDAGPPDRHAPRRTGRRLRTSAASP